jgi:hypothetical protein
MADLVTELLEVLEPFDIPTGSFLALRRSLAGPQHSVAAQFLEAALRAHLREQVLYFQTMHGREACDAGLAELTGLHDALIRVGKLTGDPLADEILVYAAHLAAMGSYGPAVWDRTSKIVLAAAMNTTEKELAKARRR